MSGVATEFKPNLEKLRRLQAQSDSVRIGGKGVPRRKKKVVHKTAATDDKKLQSSLKKISVNQIPGIEEVNMIKDDGTVMHFNNPKVQASLASNTFAVAGHAENKQITELLPGILNQLGAESLSHLRKLAGGVGGLGSTDSAAANDADDEDDDVPDLVENFDEFLFYCCPECNYKCRLHNEFNSHALVSHPMAREILVNDSENDKNLNTSPIHPAQAYNDINFDVQDQQNLSSPEEETKKNDRPLFKKENNLVVSEEIFSETPTELLEAISNDEPFGSSDEDLIDDPESQIKDVDEDLYQVIGTKVGTLRFKCSVCSHKSRYKQGIIDHVKQVHRKERPYACTTC